MPAPARRRRGDRQALTFPVDVVEGEGGDLPAAQAVGDQQQQDRVVTPACCGPAVDTGEDPVDLGPGDRAGDARQLVGLRPAHGVTQIARQDPFVVRVAHEHPQRTGCVADGALGRSGADAVDDEGAQDHRREFLDRGETDSPQVGLEALEVVPIAEHRGRPKATLLDQGSRRSLARRRRTGGCAAGCGLFMTFGFK
jgi:hypothetical protein